MKIIFLLLILINLKKINEKEIVNLYICIINMENIYHKAEEINLTDYKGDKSSNSDIVLKLKLNLIYECIIKINNQENIKELIKNYIVDKNKKIDLINLDLNKKDLVSSNNYKLSQEEVKLNEKITNLKKFKKDELVEIFQKVIASKLNVVEQILYLINYFKNYIILFAIIFLFLFIYAFRVIWKRFRLKNRKDKKQIVKVEDKYKKAYDKFEKLKKKNN